MTRNAQVGVVVGVLAAIAVVSIVVARSSKPAVPPPASSFNPMTPDAATPRPSASGPSPLVAAAADAGVTPLELRGWRTRIDADLCPKGAEQFNKLDGRAPTDPKAINIVSLCLQYGNITWYKCLLEAKDVTEAKMCNMRFLQPPPP